MLSNMKKSEMEYNEDYDLETISMYKLPTSFDKIIRDVVSEDNKVLLKKYKDNKPSKRKKVTINKKANRKKWKVPVKH